MIQEGTIVDFESDKVLVRTLFNNFDSLLVFVFYSQANPESKRYVQKLSNLLKTFGQHDNTKVFSLAAEKCPETFQKYGVETVPTVLFTQTDKKILAKLSSEITPADVLDKLATEADKFKETFEKERSKWHPKIESILSSCPIIIFIKGTPQTPKCGFTEQLLDILNKHSVQYNYYDIIADEYMRYWVRNYSKWATYPQIYIGGKLIGGLDVLKELIEKGQFQKMIKGSMKTSTSEERFSNIIKESKVVVMIDGFGFENSESKKFIEEAKSKYASEDITVLNVALDTKLKQYVCGGLGYKLPCLIIDGKPLQ